MSFGLSITENNMTEDFVSSALCFVSSTCQCGQEFWLCLDFAGAKLLFSGRAWYVIRYRGAI